MGGYMMYRYGKRVYNKTRRHIQKTGSIRGSGLGAGLLYALFAYFV